MIVRGASFLAKMFLRYPKKITRFLLVKAASYVSRFPGLRSKIVLFLNRYPILKSRLKILTISDNSGFFAHGYTRRSNSRFADKYSHRSRSVIDDDYFKKKRSLLEGGERTGFSQGLNAEKKSPLEKWFN